MHNSTINYITLLFFFCYVKKVIEVSKQYLPNTAAGFKSSKLKIHIQDAVKFIENHTKEFDVIIVDSSDPIGKNHLKFTFYFYYKCTKLLISSLQLIVEYSNLKKNMYEKNELGRGT